MIGLAVPSILMDRSIFILGARQSKKNGLLGCEHCPSECCELCACPTGQCRILEDMNLEVCICTDGDTGDCTDGDTGDCTDGDTGDCTDGDTGYCTDGDTGYCIDGDTGDCTVGDTGDCTDGDTGDCTFGDTGDYRR